jgi:hypothetical protein
MDYANVRVRLDEASAHQVGVREIIEGLIARRGYHSVIIDLVAAVHSLAEVHLADPQNRAKQHHFSLWAGAVRDAIQRHGDENTFEHRVTDSDRMAARAMGIKLD